MLPPETENTNALRRDSERLFPSFKVEATPHRPLRSENLLLHSEVGSFHTSKVTQLRSYSKQGNPLIMLLVLLFFLFIEPWIFYLSQQPELRPLLQLIYGNPCVYCWL